MTAVINIRGDALSVWKQKVSDQKVKRNELFDLIIPTIVNYYDNNTNEVEIDENDLDELSDVSDMSRIGALSLFDKIYNAWIFL